MSILKKIFSGGKAQEPESKRIQREPRITLGEHHRIVFKADKPVFEHVLRLANISSKGLAIRRADAPSLHVGDSVQGHLQIDAADFAIATSVRHITDVIAGCAILGDHPELRRAIESYLRLEILGVRLNKVDEAYLKPDPRGRVMWFTDGRNNEAYAVLDSHGIVEFHLTFLGNYVAGGRDKAIVCGYVKEEAPKDEPGHKSSALIDSSGAPTEDMLALAQALIQNIEKMPQDLKTEFLKILSAAV
jgi:hypothetical protein